MGGGKAELASKAITSSVNCHSCSKHSTVIYPLIGQEISFGQKPPSAWH